VFLPHICTEANFCLSYHGGANTSIAFMPAGAYASEQNRDEKLNSAITQPL